MSLRVQKEKNMTTRSLWLSLLLITSLVLAAGCEMGQVDQGRVIAYDKSKGTVTLIQDKEANPGKPNYNTLPPHTYLIPQDPYEMGPEPKAGLRMKLDMDKKIITVFDPATQNFKDIPFTLVDKKEGIGRDNPLVAGKTFPLIDKEKKTITEYSGRQRQIGRAHV